MGRMISTGVDVVSFLEEQHQQIKALFQQVIESRGDAREKAFFQLRRLLAVHETAEEEIVHPAARRALPDGDALVEARLMEENQAKTALAAIEKLEVDSVEFDAQIRALQTAVIAHAESEEQQEFARLGAKLDASRLEGMRKAVQFAEAAAPTRPHPGVESATANLLVGPFAAMMDRVKDALTKS